MAITLTSDPIMNLGDAGMLLGIQDDVRLPLLINSLTEKFLAYTGRIQINKDVSNSIVEWTRSFGSRKLYLRSTPVWLADGVDPLDVQVDIYFDNKLSQTYLHSSEHFRIVEAENFSSLELYSGDWPTQCETSIAKVTYYAGWAEVPGDVIQGALMQGKVDLRRLDGEAGMANVSGGGQSVGFTIAESGSLINAVKGAWDPYRILS